MPHPHNAFWPAEILQQVALAAASAPATDGWKIGRGTTQWNQGSWRSAALVETHTGLPYLAVMEAAKPADTVKLADLWPQAGRPAPSLLAQKLELRRPSLFLRGYECPSTQLADRVQHFLNPGEGTEDWKDRKVAQCFRGLDLEAQLMEPDPPGGICFEGELTLFEAGRVGAALLAQTGKPVLIQGRITAAESDDDSPEYTASGSTWLTLVWRVESVEASPWSFRLPGFDLTLLELEMEEIVEAGSTRIGMLQGEALVSIPKSTDTAPPAPGAPAKKETQLRVTLGVDLDAREASLHSHAERLLVGLDFLQDLVGREKLQGVAGDFFEGLSALKFRLASFSASISWDKGVALKHLSVTISAETEGAITQIGEHGIAVAGGTLVPSVTLTADFHDGKTDLNMQISGKMEWEKLKLRAHLDTTSGEFGAGLDWDAEAEDFMAARLGLEQTAGIDVAAPAPAPITGNTGSGPAIKKGDPTLELDFTGNYKDHSYEIEAASNQWYHLAGAKNAPFKIGHLHLYGSYTEGTPADWEIRLGGKAALGNGAVFGLSGTYKNTKVEKMFSVAFKAEELDFGDLWGTKKPAGAAGKKDLGSVSLDWKRETKPPEKNASAPVAEWETTNTFTLEASKVAVNFASAIKSILGCEIPGLEVASFEIKKLKLTHGDKEKSVDLEAKTLDAQDKLLQKKDENAIPFDIGSAKFAFSSIKLKASQKKDKEGKDKTTATLAASMKFHTWATADVSYEVGGAWSVGTTIKELQLNSLVDAFCSTQADWQLTLLKTDFKVSKSKEGDYSVSLGTEVMALGTASIAVKKMGGQWGMGMLVDIRSRSEPAPALPPGLSPEAAKKNEVVEMIHTIMDGVSLDELKLGFCTLASDKLPGAKLTGGKAGFVVKGKWVFKQDSQEAMLLDALGLKADACAVKTGEPATSSIAAQLKLLKEEQSVFLSLQNVKLAGLMVKTAELGMERSDTSFRLFCKGDLDFEIQGSKAQMIFGVDVGTQGLQLYGELKTGQALRLFDSFDANGVSRQKGVLLAQVAAAISITPKGASFGFAATMVAGKFYASVAVSLSSTPSSFLLTAAIEDINLRQIIEAITGKDIPLLQQVAISGVRIGASKGTVKQDLPVVSKRKDNGQIDNAQVLALKTTAGDLVRKMGAEISPAEDLIVIKSDRTGEKRDTWYVMDKVKLMHYAVRQDSATREVEVYELAQLKLVTSDLTLGGTTYKKCFFLNAAIQIFKFEAQIRVEISGDGVAAMAYIKPFELLHELFFSIKASDYGKDLLRKRLREGKSADFNDEEGPDGKPRLGKRLTDAEIERRVSESGALLSLSTFARKGNPNVPKDFQGVHFFLDAKVTLLGLSASVYCHISENKVEFDLVGAFLALTAKLNVVTGGEAALTVKGSLEFKIGKIGPININSGVTLTTDIIVGGQRSALYVSVGASLLLFGEHIEIGDLRLDIDNGSFSSLADLVKTKVFDRALSWLGLEKATKLGDKFRWMTIEVVNETGCSLISKGLVYSESGGYWQAPVNIPPCARGSYTAASNHGSIARGACGVTQYTLRSRHSERDMHIMHSHPTLGVMKCRTIFGLSQWKYDTAKKFYGDSNKGGDIIETDGEFEALSYRFTSNDKLNRVVVRRKGVFIARDIFPIRRDDKVTLLFMISPTGLCYSSIGAPEEDTWGGWKHVQRERSYVTAAMCRSGDPAEGRAGDPICALLLTDDGTLDVMMYTRVSEAPWKLLCEGQSLQLPPELGKNITNIAIHTPPAMSEWTAYKVVHVTTNQGIWKATLRLPMATCQGWTQVYKVPETMASLAQATAAKTPGADVLDARFLEGLDPLPAAAVVSSEAPTARPKYDEAPVRCERSGVVMLLDVDKKILHARDSDAAFTPLRPILFATIPAERRNLPDAMGHLPETFVRLTLTAHKGTLNCFAIATDASLWRISHNVSRGWKWERMEVKDIQTPDLRVKAVAAGVSSYNHLELFITMQDGTLCHNASADGGETWHTWEVNFKNAPKAERVFLSTGPDARMEIYLVHHEGVKSTERTLNDRRVYHNRLPRQGSWLPDWRPL